MAEPPNSTAKSCDGLNHSLESARIREREQRAEHRRDDAEPNDPVVLDRRPGGGMGRAWRTG